MSSHQKYGICASCGGKRSIRKERVTNLCRDCFKSVQRRISTEAWMSHAACTSKQYHPEWWTGSGEFNDLATHICRTSCRVRRACLAWAINNDEREHVYGGMTSHDRSMFRAHWSHLLTDATA